MIKFLKYFTFLTQSEIAALESEHQERPEGRIAHKALARAVTTMVHGESATLEAIKASDILFGGELSGITEGTFRELAAEIPAKNLARARFNLLGTPSPQECVVQADDGGGNGFR